MLSLVQAIKSLSARPKMETEINDLNHALYPPLQTNQSHLKDLNEYKQMYAESIKEPASFWSKAATDHIEWFKPFTRVTSGSFQQGDVKWFEDGKLNVAYNCIDRHALKTPDKIAIIYEADDPNQTQAFTYKQLLEETY
jgi:acetyl-CoA synthetase